MEILNENEIQQVSGGTYTGPVFTYTIKKGDCLSVLAQKYHSTVQELAELNGIQDVNKIYAGATLKIPYRG